MSRAADWGAALLFSVTPSDRALTGWESGTNADLWLGALAEQDDLTDLLLSCAVAYRQTSP